MHNLIQRLDTSYNTLKELIDSLPEESQTEEVKELLVLMYSSIEEAKKTEQEVTYLLSTLE